MNEDIEPCPFCGDPMKHTEILGVYHLECTACSYRTPGMDELQEDIVDLHNRMSKAIWKS